MGDVTVVCLDDAWLLSHPNMAQESCPQHSLLWVGLAQLSLKQPLLIEKNFTEVFTVCFSLGNPFMVAL